MSDARDESERSLSGDLEKLMAELEYAIDRGDPEVAQRLLEQCQKAFAERYAHLGFREDMTLEEMREQQRVAEECVTRLADLNENRFKHASEVTDKDVLRKRRRISAYWFVVLQGVAIVVFWALSTETSPWWLDAIGYLASFLALGALIEVVKTTKALRQSIGFDGP